MAIFLLALSFHCVGHERGTAGTVAVGCFNGGEGVSSLATLAAFIRGGDRLEIPHITSRGSVYRE